MPSRFELETVQPGTAVDTPYGQIVAGADGRQEIQFTPEGKQLWAQEISRMRRDYGASPVGGDANAPKPKMTPGKSFFNPFLGRWGS
jgi:hypothetical protein